MKIKDGEEKDYQDWKDKNRDPYGTEIFRYAESWADMMEKSINPYEDIQDKINSIAKKLSHDADTTGITGFMYGAAVKVLAFAWLYGEELRKWHNLDTQIGTEGERANKNGGVINPAIMNVRM